METMQFTFQKNGIEEKLIVEAGHIYTDEEPAADHEYGVKIGATVTKFFTSLGYQVEKWLFIDNYTPLFTETSLLLNEDRLNEDNYFKSLEELGFKPDVTVYEADLVTQAQDEMGSLLEKKLAAESGGGSVSLNKSSISLYDASKDKFSCSLLDACFYLQKLQSAAGVITILPWRNHSGKLYKSQQKETLIILEKLGVNTSALLPVYFVSPFENPPSKDVQNSRLVYGDSPFVRGITLLKALAKMTEHFPVKTGLELEVMKYVV